MESGRDISQRFIETCLLPVLRRELPGAIDRLAVAIVGIGSDVTGMDDEISRDHHWSPRANVMLAPREAGELLPRVAAALETAMPETFDGFPVHIDNTIMTGLCCCSIDRFFEYYLGTSALPKKNADWVALTEVDLGHVTSGLVVFDGPGELTARREYLAYYPDAVWRKRIADWCMYITGRDAPYNLHRTVKRGDTTTARLYRAAYCKQVMELCFALNRRYSTYTKWLNRSYRTLPRFAPDIAAMIDGIMESDDLAQNVRRMIEVNYALGDAIAELGLASPPLRKEFDDALTVLTLYDTAAEIYSTIPADLVRPSFNRTEMWERLVRDALFAPEDCHNKGRSGPLAEHLARAE